MAGAAGGSNNWAVSPKRRATGGALIAGDPHLPSAMPGIWHQIALELGDRFCRGASIPGIPGITMGQNNDVAWTFTNVMADVEDLFVERIEGDSYEFEGEWRPLESIEEEIAVKGRRPSGSRSASPATARSSTTRSAPTPPSRWRCAGPQCDSPGIDQAHLEIFEPRTGAELVELLDDLTMPVSNLIWADRDGASATR